MTVLQMGGFDFFDNTLNPELNEGMSAINHYVPGEGRPTPAGAPPGGGLVWEEIDPANPYFASTNISDFPTNTSHRCGFAAKVYDTARGIELATYLGGGAALLSLVVGEAGKLEIWTGFGAVGATMLGQISVWSDTEKWRYIEFGANWSTTEGEYWVYVNGGLRKHETGVDLGTDTQADTLWLTPERYDDADSPCHIAIDDFYLLNGAGDYANDFLGESNVRLLSPIADATYHQWQPGGTHYNLVDDIPFVITGGITVPFSVVGTTDTYQFTQITDWPDETEVYAIRSMLLGYERTLPTPIVWGHGTEAGVGPRSCGIRLRCLPTSNC